jgi:glyoxylase-like metal-dependent hydrolase (beta-lactamase superfamily II)
MRVACVLSVLIALVGLPALGRAETYAPLNSPLTIERVPGKDIFYSLGNPKIPSKENEGNTSNAGYVVTADGVVVFDALGTPSLGWALLQDIRSRTDKDVRYVVVSHYHADHIYGLQAFKDNTSAQIIAQERSADYTENSETSEERADTRLDQRKSVLWPWVNESTRIVKPDRTFKDDLDISLGGKKFSLIYAGPAHSSSDIMMLVEPDGVLFAGDIVQNGRIPFMNADDVNTARWLEALEKVRKLDPKFIIPGHGRPSSATQEAISFTKDYITYVRAAMAKAVDDWADFDAAYQATDWSRYAKLPAFESNNRGNAYRIYLELQSAQFKK